MTVPSPQPRLRYHGSVKFGGCYEVRREGATVGYVRRSWDRWLALRCGGATWSGPHKRMRDAGVTLAEAVSS